MNCIPIQPVSQAKRQMDEKKWQNVKEIFLDALEKTSGEREEFLSKIGNEEIRAEVESLLVSHEEIEDFIEVPVFQVGEVFSEKPSANLADKHFGHYKIICEIGAGGMGAVFLAERDDGEFSQKVALKIVRQTVAEKELINRFRRERQILANLNHPNIAKLLDGGITESGEPFLVMEFVEGETLSEFVRRKNPNLETRLKLFLKICAAVAYAHRNLTVHRDIKPSNILVTEGGEPKLLDFGLAKLSEQTAEEKTQTAFHALTPAYASPEQLKNEAITTSSDIYSLGVVFYELLTNEKPFHFEGKSLEEIIKTATQREPSAPSFAKAEREKGRRGERENVDDKLSFSSSPFLPFSLSRLKGDLDNIALTALRKEPTRRYQTVEAFADDIERYLSGLPVAARPNTVQYRVSKFIKRHKAGVAAASLILLSLVVGIIATVWQAQVAQREKEKAELVSSFLRQILKYSNPVYTTLQKAGQDATINDVLDEATKRIKKGEFDLSPEVKAELLHTIAESYSSQGNRPLAEELMQEYIELTSKIYAENHPKRIESLMILASLIFSKGEMIESEKLYREVLPKLRDEQKKGNIEAEILADALNNFAYLRRTQGDSREAEMLFREALSFNPEMSADKVNYINGATRSVLASTLADQGKFEEALQTSREGVEEQRQNGFTKTPTFGFNLTILSGFLTEKGEFAEADLHLREAEDIFRKNISPNSLWLGDNLRNQAISRYFQGEYAESINKSDETLKIYLTFGKHYDQYPTVLIFKGLSLAKIGRLEEGEKLLREAVEIRRKSLPKEHFWVAIAESALGECLTTQKKFAEAETLLTESFESLKTSQGAENPRTILAQNRLNRLYEVWKK